MTMASVSSKLFVQAGHETTNASSVSIFFTTSYHNQTYQNYDQ